MDLLQIALVFLIILLSLFLAITGLQVFFILRDLHKALKRLNRILESGEDIAQDIEKPVAAAAKLVDTLESGAKTLNVFAKKSSKPKPQTKRFFKKL